MSGRTARPAPWRSCSSRAPPNPTSVSAATLISLQTTQALERVAVDLDGRRALGTHAVVSWARYKTVGVRATVVIHPAADPGEIRSRLMDRLQRTISPVASAADSPGWPFGQALRASDVYATLLSEPSVRFVEDVAADRRRRPRLRGRRPGGRPDPAAHLVLRGRADGVPLDGRRRRLGSERALRPARPWSA